MKVNVCDDRALVTGRCLRVRALTLEIYVWWRAPLPRVWIGRTSV